ncbi:putative zinc finger CCHC domain-containing protein 3-like [Apostichopus japonicus]|uniref:Putative zinc finger CCHC domain-containing protein 3-like n=1 Tax=Stichopus japonicus TaxID=307972 RepID=A0A2G8JUV6_STIJA|nr:putative zinc finger CCHC domain-containing protein 3-like [Apostichopus japonicus]
MCSYAQAPGVLNGHRQVRIDLKQDIPSFLFIAGHKADVRYPGQPRTCFRCWETGHEAKVCPNKKCGRCLRLGHDTSACPSEVVCSLCGKEGHVFRACPSSYVFMTKSGGQAKAPSSGAPTASEEAPRKEGEPVRIHFPHLVHPPVVADPTPCPHRESLHQLPHQLADDCVCYRVIDDVSDGHQLQEDINILGQWAKD